MSAVTDLAAYREHRRASVQRHLIDASSHIAMAQAHIISARPPDVWNDARIALQQLKEISEDIAGWLSTNEKREPAVHTDSRHAEAHPNAPATQRGV